MAMLATVLVTMSGAIVAAPTAHAAAPSPFNDQPASPRSLPADNLPPFAMLDDHGQLIPTPQIPATALHRGADSPPESTAPGPNLAQATEAARVALQACLAHGYRVGVAVVDSVGEARAMLTADGSDGSHVFVAMRKAIVALAFQMPSSEASERVPKQPALLARVTPAMFVEGGAVPIHAGGKVIGAIGVSGAAGSPIGHQDELCAQQGALRILKK
ncbi:MAG: heme-binding protein [Steroidobacteraceae bacterium]